MTSFSHKAITAVCNGPLNSLVAYERMSLKTKNEKDGKIYTVLDSRKKLTHTIKVEREVAKHSGNPNTWKSMFTFTVSYANSEMNTVPGNIEEIIKGILDSFHVNPAFSILMEEDTVEFILYMNETEDMIGHVDAPRVVFDPIAIDRVIYNVFWVLLRFQVDPAGYIPVRQPVDKKKRKSHQISGDEAGGNYDTEDDDDHGDHAGPAPVFEAQAQVVTHISPDMAVVQAQPIVEVPADMAVVQAQPIVDVPADMAVVQAQPIVDVPADTAVVQAQPFLDLSAIMAEVMRKVAAAETDPVEAVPAPAGVVEAVPAPAGVVEAAPAPAGVVEAAPAPAGVVEAAPAPAGVVEAVPAPAGVVEAAPAIKPEPVHDPKAEIIRLVNEDNIDRAAIVRLVGLLEVKKPPKKMEDAETCYEMNPVGREVLLVGKMVKTLNTEELKSIVKNATLELRARKVAITTEDSNGQAQVDLTGEDD